MERPAQAVSGRIPDASAKAVRVQGKMWFLDSAFKALWRLSSQVGYRELRSLCVWEQFVEISFKLQLSIAAARRGW